MAADYDEWIKKLPGGLVVKYSCELLTRGFSTSAEVAEPPGAAMVYTHTHTGVPAPSDREAVEAEFAPELKALAASCR